MILADTLDISRVLPCIPREARAAAKKCEIYSASIQSDEYGILGFHPDIMACSYAWPHHDAGWFSGKMFLTLTLISKDHVLCDEDYGKMMRLHGDQNHHQTGVALTPGSLCIINPERIHWMCTKDAWLDMKPRPWVSLQWVVPRDKAKKVARAIVEKFSGKWVAQHDDDPRYTSYAPKELQLS